MLVSWVGFVRLVGLLEDYYNWFGLVGWLGGWVGGCCWGSWPVGGIVNHSKPSTSYNKPLNHARPSNKPTNYSHDKSNKSHSHPQCLPLVSRAV